MTSAKKNNGKTIIENFDPYELLPDGKPRHKLHNKNILVIGPREMGKSFLFKHGILPVLAKKIPIGTFISGSEDGNGYYSEFVPQTFIFGDYDDSVIDKFLTRQKKKSVQAKKLKKQGKPIPNIRALLLMDDCLGDDDWKKNKSMKKLIFDGRHWHTTLAIVVQEPVGFPNSWRGMIDYIFLTTNSSGNDLEKIYKQYANGIGFKNLNEFKKVHNLCTQDHSVMVLKRSKSTELTDRVFKFKAEYQPDFRFGHPKFWNYNRKNYDDKWFEKQIKLEEEKQKVAEHKRKLKKEKEMQAHVEITTVNY